MSKFNVNAIRGFSSLGKEEEIDEPVQRTKLGEGLLNAASKALYADSIYLEYIPRDQIDVNEKNFYTIGDVSSLKESIYTCGLGQPLIVKKLEKGRYRLLSGERRLTAIDQLIQEGKWKTEIPCVLQDFEKINLPMLSDEQKEMYCVITTNREQRDYKDADLMNEIMHLKKIYTELRKAGVDDILVGLDEKGDEIHRQVKGKKRRS